MTQDTELNLKDSPISKITPTKNIISTELLQIQTQNVEEKIKSSPFKDQKLKKRFKTKICQNSSFNQYTHSEIVMDSQKPKNLLTKLPAIKDLEIDNENHEDYDVETQPAGLTY